MNHNMGRDNGLTVVYILAPVTILLAIGVITYIIVKQRQLTRRMIESGKWRRQLLFWCIDCKNWIAGQLVPVMPAVVAYQQYPTQQQQQQELRSPTTGGWKLFYIADYFT